jgi:hypothetical protein
LKNVWLKERENNLFVVLISLVLITIPLPYIYSSIATITLAFFAVLELLYNKKINSNNNLIYPILLFVLMVASLLWTIDFQLTKEALVKELSLFGIPICFLFLNFKEEIKLKVMAIYSYAMTVYCVYYLLSALIKYQGTGDSSVFFYHNLVTLDVNAIHVSVYFSISCIYFIQKKNKLFIATLTDIIIYDLETIFNSEQTNDQLCL